MAQQLSAERLVKFREELNRVFPGIGDKFDGKRAMMNWPKYNLARGKLRAPWRVN